MEELSVNRENALQGVSRPRVSQDVKQNTGIAVAYAEHVHTGNITINSNGGQEDDIGLDDMLLSDYCNVLVAHESFEGFTNCFMLGIKAIPTVERDGFDGFDKKVRFFPTLFVTTNGKYRNCANPNQAFFYGKITGVVEKRRFAEIRFRKLFNKPMPQYRLNEVAVTIGVNTVSGVDLLDKTGWLIRPVDIRKALSENGIEYK